MNETNEISERHPAQDHHYITTRSGRRIRMPNIHASQVHLGDIAHSLSNQCRFQGHTQTYYSVAEHSVLVADLAEAEGHDEMVVRAALLHDAHEAYLGDFPSPFKVAVPELRDFEAQVQTAVLEALGLPPITDDVWRIVRHFDLDALHLEAKEFFPAPPDWIDFDRIDAVKGTQRPRGYPPMYAHGMFMQRLRDLGLGLGGNA